MSPQAAAFQSAARSRVLALDVLRGLAVLLLVPDLQGGFSLYRVAAAHPGDPIWHALATTFRHAPWVGVTLWDLVMPLFVFAIGVSMALAAAANPSPSFARRLARAARRSTTLVLLGLLLVFGVRSATDELVLATVVATGLPVGHAAARLFGRPAAADALQDAFGWAAVALGFAWLAAHPQRSGDYELNQILVLIGFAYLPASMLLGARPSVQIGAALALLAAYAAAFLAHANVHLAWPWAAEAVASAWPRSGNAAAAFDAWLFGALPRTTPYDGNASGDHTLVFVPLAAVMLAAAPAGKALARGVGERRVARGCALAGLAALALAGVLAQAGFPVVKTLWTPAWTAFCTGVCLLFLAALLAAFAHGARPWIAGAIAVLGSNALLLYVLAYAERWRIVALWRPLLDTLPALAPWRPLAEALTVLATLWLVGFVLHRRGILIRL